MIFEAAQEPEPVSNYARWKLEEDERFYATFPEARQAADQYSRISEAYLEGTGYYYDADGRVAFCRELASSSQLMSYPPAGRPSPETTPLHYDYNYVHHAESPQASPSVSTPHIPRDCVTRRGRNEVLSPSQYHVSGHDPAHLSGPSTEIIHTNVVVPSQHIPIQSEPPYMDHLPSPTSSSASHPSTPHADNYHSHSGTISRMIAILLHRTMSMLL
ncbi:hypothetical protein DXG03_002056 [Asterophora parasitica]|uniref:Uncharacterized protein n=1 Tax=Asterophora parasitica TaxID=117018 RepID=A0A9P7KBE4_9AGAR|nr:hypothetical protein DXG03_002056 [Asterophora parasitica]